MQAHATDTLSSRRRLRRTLVEGFAFAVCFIATVSSAVSAKRGSFSAASLAPALVSMENVALASVAGSPRGEAAHERVAASPAPTVEVVEIEEIDAAESDAQIRWYDGRRIRPVKTMWMVVTAYSPDEKSCGKWADGVTASMKSVWTNGGRLVAADTRILKFGSLITVPGYADDEVVPVLDRGGAIKGMRLDVLYPTHEIALEWGRQRLPITVWEYAD